MKGILPAMLLALLEERYCEGNIGEYFDLIVGTSIGGITALGLGASITAKEMSNLYTQNGHKAFPPLRGFRKHVANILSLLRRRRSRAALDRMLDETFGKTILGESRCRLCIPSLDTEFGGEIFVFKTPHHRDYQRDWKRDMATIAKGTSAAPAYIEPYRDAWNEFLDGGLWANNPIMVGVIEAISAFDVQRKNIKVLSMGCIESRYGVGWFQRTFGGTLFWAPNIVNAAMHFQSQNAIGQASLLLGRNNILRLASPHMVDKIDLDDWEKARQILPKIAKRLFDTCGETLAAQFLGGKASTYKPMYP